MSQSTTAPVWPECHSSIIEGLSVHPDQELLQLFQRQPTQARYFVGIVCRFSPVIESLLQARLPEAQHTFWRRRVWQHLYTKIRSLDLYRTEDLRAWFKAQGEQVLSQRQGVEIPEPQLNAASELSPALSCYLTDGLAQIAPDLRFILILSDRFQWTLEDITSQLIQEGYEVSVEETQNLLAEARHQLFEALPVDIRALYLTTKSYT